MILSRYRCDISGEELARELWKKGRSNAMLMRRRWSSVCESCSTGSTQRPSVCCRRRWECLLQSYFSLCKRWMVRKRNFSASRRARSSSSWQAPHAHRRRQLSRARPFLETLLQLGAMRTSRGGSGGRKTAVQLARLSGHEEFANALIAAEYVEPLKSELRRRLRRVMIIAYRFQQVFYVVSLRPGYSGFQRCRSTFEMNASIHDAS